MLYIPQGHPLDSVNADLDSYHREEEEYDRRLEEHRNNLILDFEFFKDNDKLNPFNEKITLLLEKMVDEADLDESFEDLLRRFSETVIYRFDKVNGL